MDPESAPVGAEQPAKEQEGSKKHKKHKKPNGTEELQEMIVVSGSADASSASEALKTDKALFRSVGYNLSWRDVNYKVNVKKFPWSKPQPKTLLQNMCGHVVAGKSTMLDVLADRVRKGTHLTGEVLVNGLPRGSSSFKRLANYVMQDDTLQGSLTVAENLLFSANIRLPAHYTPAERKRMVKELIEVLGLNDCVDTIIGLPFRRGLSAILFLDEPTSGLDSLSAFKICEMLKTLARTSNMTVICTIHQPASRVFESFDNLLLISQGQQVYMGGLQHALKYFSGVGLIVPQHANPADYYADAINQDFSGDAEKGNEVQRYVTSYEQSSERAAVISLVEKDKAAAASKTAPAEVESYARNFFVQLWYLLLRTGLIYAKNPGLVHLRVGMYIFMGLFLGTIYWRIELSQSHIMDRVSALFFGASFLTFMSIAAFPAVIEDRLIFVRERANGYYRVGAYALAHSIWQLPTTFLMSLGYTLIAYWLIGYINHSENVIFFILTLMMGLYAAESITMLVAAVVPWYIIGIAMGAGLYGMFMLVMGFFVKLQNIPVGWKWMHYISLHTYMFQGFMINEFGERDWACDAGAAGSCVCLYPDQNNDCVISSFELLDYFGIAGQRKWTNFGYLLIFCGIVRVLYYVVLRTFNKGKR